MGPIEIVDADAGGAAARWAMSQYFAELDRRFVGGFVVGSALDDAVESFTAPAGRFVLAVRDGETVGCGGLTHVDAATSEIKRMWVADSARGAGLGTRLLAHLEGLAVEAGRHRVVLDTNGVLTEAITMYRRAGYRDIGRYNDNEYAQLWFEKDV